MARGVKFAIFQEGFCEFIPVITRSAPPPGDVLLNIYLENKNSTTTQTDKHYHKDFSLGLKYLRVLNLTIYKLQENGETAQVWINKLMRSAACLVTKTLMWGCEVRIANSHNSTAHYPGWQTQQQYSLPSQSEASITDTWPIRGQYYRLLTNQRPGRGLMMSSSLVTIQLTFYSELTLTLEGVTGTHKIQTCLIGHKLAHLDLNSEARSGELKKSISLLEMILLLVEYNSVLWIYHNQAICGINQKLFEYHT